MSNSNNDNGQGVTFTMAQMQAMLDAQQRAFQATMQAQIEAMRAEVGTQLESAVRRGSGAKDLPDETLGSIFERFAVKECDSANIGTDRHRPKFPSWQTVMYQRALILDLEFEYPDGHKMTLRGLPCSRLTRKMALAWHARLRETPKQDGSDYARSSIDRCVTTFQGVVSWALGEGDRKEGRQSNPLKMIPREGGSEDARKGHFKDEEQLGVFLSRCRPLLGDMWRLAVNSGGMRKNELRLLSTCEIDWDIGLITFEATPAGLPRRTKNGKGRFFGVLPSERAMMQRRREETEGRAPCADAKCRMPRYLRAIGKSPEHWHVFASQQTASADPVNYFTLSNWQQDAAKAWAQADNLRGRDAGKLAGNEVPSLHHARHTWATWAAQKGYGLESVVREGGWSDPKQALAYIKHAAELIENNKAVLSRSVREVQAEKQALARKVRAA